MTGRMKPAGKSKRNVRGQRPFEPTDDMRDRVRLMVAGGMDQPCICAVIGCSIPTLHKYFRDDLDHGYAHIGSIVLSAHLDRIKAGDMRAIEWWEKSRLGWSEKVTIDDGKGDAPVRVIVELVGDAAPVRTISGVVENRAAFNAAKHVQLIG